MLFTLLVMEFKFKSRLTDFMATATGRLLLLAVELIVLVEVPSWN